RGPAAHQLWSTAGAATLARLGRAVRRLPGRLGGDRSRVRIRVGQPGFLGSPGCRRDQLAHVGFAACTDAVPARWRFWHCARYARDACAGGADSVVPVARAAGHRSADVDGHTGDASGGAAAGGTGPLDLPSWIRPLPPNWIEPLPRL